MIPASSTGAFATFYFFRSQGISSRVAHTYVAYWSRKARSEYEANPLCVATRRAMSAHYSKTHNGD